MTTRNPRHAPVGAPGFKALVTAVSLAVTVGGWAVIASNTPPASQQANNTLPPMPTLVPTPEPYTAPAVSTNLRSSVIGGASAARPTAAAPNLRSVTINPNSLPRANAITRSSR